MKHFFVLVLLAACTPSSDPNGANGASGNAGNAGTRGPTGATGEQGPPGPDGSGDDRSAILAKLAATPFQKSAPIDMFSGVVQNATVTTIGGYPQVVFGSTAPGVHWTQNVFVPLDATPGQAAEVHFIIVDATPPAGDCTVNMMIGAGLGFRIGVSFPATPSSLAMETTVPQGKPALVIAQAGNVNPGDVLNLNIKHNASATGVACAQPGIVSGVLVYSSATP